MGQTEAVNQHRTREEQEAVTLQYHTTTTSATTTTTTTNNNNNSNNTNSNDHNTTTPFRKHVERQRVWPHGDKLHCSIERRHSHLHAHTHARVVVCGGGGYQCYCTHAHVQCTVVSSLTYTCTKGVYVGRVGDMLGTQNHESAGTTVPQLDVHATVDRHVWLIQAFMRVRCDSARMSFWTRTLCPIHIPYKYRGGRCGSNCSEGGGSTHHRQQRAKYLVLHDGGRRRVRVEYNRRRHEPVCL